MYTRVYGVNNNTYDRKREYSLYQGRPQDLAGGGGKNYFLSDLEICMSLHGEAMRFARGVRGHAPPRKFFKMVQFGAFWRIF